MTRTRSSRFILLHGAGMVTLGELVHCTYQDSANVRRWISHMKTLKHWAGVHGVADGFTATLQDKEFVSI